MGILARHRECDQHEAILIGCDGCLLFEMLLHQHLYLLFPQLPECASLSHQGAYREKNFPSPALKRPVAGRAHCCGVRRRCTRWSPGQASAYCPGHSA